MVAEKPSIARSITDALVGGNHRQRRGKSPICPVFEFDYRFFGEMAHFKVTSVCGHIYSTDFPGKFNSWTAVDPIDLYDAETVKIENSDKVTDM